MDDAVGEDEAMFAGLYPRLRAFASMVGPRRMDPDDLVQEALARTLRRHALRDLDQPLAYLKRVVRNLATDEIRANGRHGEQVSANSAEAVVPVYPSDLSDLELVPFEDRALIHMVHVEGASYADAVAVFGGSEEGLRKRSSRALHKLRSVLVERDAEEDERGRSDA